MDNQQHVAERQLELAKKLDRWLSDHWSPYRIGPMGTTVGTDGSIRPIIVLRFENQFKGAFDSVVRVLEHIEDKPLVNAFLLRHNLRY